jgi:NSS family neurotransmitter:Na+ symporter
VKRRYWQTHLGIYLASIGSALGLGNFWRFPYVVAENGGGAFLILFLALLFIAGLPILIFELIMGRLSGKSILIGVKKMITSPRWAWLGWLPILVAGCILAYYSIVAGWLLHFVSQFFREVLLLHNDPKIVSFTDLSNNSVWQFSLASVHILIVSFILLKGFEDGLERAVKYLSPIALVVILGVILNLFNQPSSGELWRYLFYPDFSKLNAQSLLMGLGQVFFTTSLGMGVMVTYGSFVRESAHLPTIGFRIIIVDTLIAIAAAVMIFGVAKSLGHDNLAEPSLLFVVIPSYFFELSSGLFLGFSFFSVLYLVSILSSIGLLEVMISNFSDYFKWSRQKSLIVSSALIMTGIIIFLLVTYLLRTRKINSILAFDAFLVNFILPCVVVVVTWFLQRAVPKIELRKLFVSDEIIESVALYKEWRGVLNWFIPLLLFISLIVYVFGRGLL